jgi:hypothetical protein
MLPINPAWKEGSMMDLIETTPKMDLAIQDIEHLVEELRAYHAIYSPLFQRREQREAAHSAQVDRADGAGGGRCRPQGRTGHAILY